jgi:hypothetical protein
MKRLFRKNHNSFEKSITLKHGLFLLTLNVIIFVLFIFIFIPLLIKYSAYLKDSNYKEEVLEIYLPQTPILNALPKNTNQDLLQVSGFAQANSNLWLNVNDKEIEKTKVNDQGAFNTEVELDEGENNVYVYTINDEKQKSSSSKEYMIYLDQEEPYLDIFEPAPDQEFSGAVQKLLTIRGVTKSNAKVYINGRLTRAKISGDFNTQYSLEEGDNLLKVEVLDEAGNTTEQELTIKYKE